MYVEGRDRFSDPAAGPASADSEYPLRVLFFEVWHPSLTTRPFNSIRHSIRTRSCALSRTNRSAEPTDLLFEMITFKGEHKTTEAKRVQRNADKAVVGGESCKLCGREYDMLMES